MSKASRRQKTIQSKLTNYIPSGKQGRHSMRNLSKERVEIAFSRMTGLNALKFLHPRRLRNAIINKQVPEGTFKPTME